MSLKVEKLVNGRWKQNCYMVSNPLGEAILIDPGSAGEQIKKSVESQKLKVLGIINTHAHYDHIAEVADLKEQFSVSFYLSSEDLSLLRYANLYRKAFKEETLISIPEVEYFLDQIELPVALGNFSIDVVFTPGHTPGGVCLLIDMHLFTGDTLFRGKIWHSKFPGYDREALCTSLKKLSQLAPDLEIYPGHGKVSNLQYELQHNAEFREMIQ